MRFRFCGDLDCPDWILAEINTLARLTSVKMKLMCQQVVKPLLGEEVDYEKIKKLTADSKFETGDVKASVAAVAFILTSSARHSVDEEVLNSELQQLGLPREHSVALCRVYREHLAGITSRLRARSLRLSQLNGVQWRIDVPCGSSIYGNMETSLQPEVHLSFDVSDHILNRQRNHQLTLSVEQLQMLIADLQKASTLMDSL